jgi:hypothetical protein
MSKRRKYKTKKGKNAAVQVTSAVKVCQEAIGAHLAAGYSAFGPITGQLDALSRPANQVTPAVRVAAEQVAHFVEAWRYVSSALQAFMTNARDNALHFAYYAELRASLSLFAYSGISINQFATSYYLDAAGSKVAFDVEGNRTHSVVWAIWVQWVQRPDAQALLKNIRLAPSVKLDDFTASLSGYAPQAVLKDWGYDLVANAKDDRRARNDSTYNPLLADKPLFQMDNDCLELITDVWRSLIVGINGIGFDEELIKYLVDRSVKAMISKPPTDPDYAADYAKRRKRIAEEVSKSTGATTESIEQLLSSKFSERIFDCARERKSETENVLCRAFFLLRLASLAVQRNLELKASAPAREWFKNWLINAGLFPSDGSVAAPQDMVADYELALSSFAPDEPFPRGIWDKHMVEHASRLARPDAFLSWGLPFQ